jgi:hypothetical protein
MWSFKGLSEIPLLKISAYRWLFQSLQGLGGPNNKIIILPESYERLADRYLSNNYSKTVYTDVSSNGMGKTRWLMLKRIENL